MRGFEKRGGPSTGRSLNPRGTAKVLKRVGEGKKSVKKMSLDVRERESLRRIPEERVGINWVSRVQHPNRGPRVVSEGEKGGVKQEDGRGKTNLESLRSFTTQG